MSCDKKKEERQKFVENAVAHQEIEGLVVDNLMREKLKQYADGNLSIEEMKQQFLNEVLK